MVGELGHCLINEYEDSTSHNPNGWNRDTVLIFLDQPVGVGFSYVNEGADLPASSVATAIDVRVVLQMLVSQVFPEHLGGSLFISGESYAVSQHPMMIRGGTAFMRSGAESEFQGNTCPP